MLCEVFTYCESGSRRELAPDPHEQRLQRQLGSEVELLQLPPGLPHGLGRPLRARETLTPGVGLQQLQLVQVDRRTVGADADREQVAVPGAELLELGEQLLALGAARRALHALVGLPRGEVEPRDL